MLGCAMRNIVSRLKEINIFFYPLVPSHFKGIVEKLRGPKPADYFLVCKKSSSSEFETFSEYHKVKAECVPASTKSGNFPSCGNGGFKRYLPRLKCLLSKPACTSGICPPKSAGVLGKNQLLHNQPQ